MRKLIINGDDFGLDESRTKAIYEAYQKGLITSTTMVANCEGFDLAARLATEGDIRGRVGVHFNLTEGEPLTRAMKECSLFVSGGVFIGQINRVKPLTASGKAAVYEELTAQIEKIQAAGISVDHADSHHHMHTAIFVAPIWARVCHEHGITHVRIHRNTGDVPIYKRLVKKLYNNWLARESFISTEYMGSLADVKLRCGEGSLEIMVHPNYDEAGRLVDTTAMTMAPLSELNTISGERVGFKGL